MGGSWDQVREDWSFPSPPASHPQPLNMACCSRIVTLLLDYLEARLPRDTHEELDHHLRACSSCVAYLRTYRSTISLLHSVSEDDLPPELRMTLHAFLDQHGDN